MAYVKIIDGVVIQKSCLPEEGFIEVSDDIVCGMIEFGASFITPGKSAESNAVEKAQVLHEAREMRSEIFNALGGIAQWDISPSDTVALNAIIVARQALKNLPTDPAVVAAVTGAETHTAVMAVWKTIAATLELTSPTAAVAFKIIAMW